MFDQLTTGDLDTVDFWQYADFLDQERPVKIRQGASTVCVVRRDTQGYPDRMKGHLRFAMATARFAEPFAVWLR